MKQKFWFLFAVLLCSRALCLAFPPKESDVRWAYGLVAVEYLTAQEQNRVLYDVRRANFERWVAESLAKNPPVIEAPEQRLIEYPPVALLAVKLPAQAFTLADYTADLVQFLDSYQRLFRIEMAICELVLFLTLAYLISRVYGHESAARQGERLLGYLIATFILSYFLYDRLDILMAALSLGALALLCSQRHYAWGFAVLAIAINFKLVPAVLAPVFLLGSLPSESLVQLSWRTVSQLAGRGLLLAGMVVGCFLPFYLADGPDTLGFFEYHRDRGLQLESIYSSAQLAMHAFGYPVEAYTAHGSENIRSGCAPVLMHLASVALVGTHLVGVLICFGLLRNSAKLVPAPHATGGTLAQRHPEVILGSALLVFLAFVLTNKVFSPQYMLWLVALVPLAPLPVAARRYAMCAFVLACTLTTILVPVLYASDVVVFTREGVRLPPTPRAVLLLVMRNALILGLTIGMAVGLVKLARERRAPTATG